MIGRGKTVHTEREELRPEIVLPNKPITRGREIRGPKRSSADVTLSVSGPSLIRWDRWVDDAQNVDALRVYYHGEATPARDETYELPSIGTYTYLPHAGRYTFHNEPWSAFGQGTEIVGVLYENVDPTLALALMTSPTPAFIAPTTLYNLASGVAQRIDLLSSAGFGGHTYAFRASSVKVTNHGLSGGTPFTDNGPVWIAHGVDAAIEFGHVVMFRTNYDASSDLITGAGISACAERDGTIISVTVGYR